ncbi:hypothetical protein [Paracoccus versutus]
MPTEKQMPELDAAIERLKAATPQKAPWTLWDFSDRGEVPIDKDIATILNAVVSGKLTRADLCASGQQVRASIEIARSHLSDIVAARGMFGVRAEDDLEWAMKTAELALAALTPAQQPEGQVRALADGVALTPAPDAAQTEAVPVAWRIKDTEYATVEYTSLRDNAVRRAGLAGYEVTPLYAHPTAPAPGIAEADIEIMARAMCESDMADFDAPSSQHTANGQDPEDQREYWRDKARIALRALANGGSDD